MPFILMKKECRVQRLTSTDPLVIKKNFVNVEKVKRKENYFFREKGM